MILILLVLLVIFGFGGGYVGSQRWGTGGGIGIFGVVLLILVLYMLFGGGFRNQ